MEPLEFRSVTDLEEVAALADDDSLLLVSNGAAKQIKKTNAKLGGGATTIYYVDVTAAPKRGGIAVRDAATPSTLVLLDADGNAVTAQQVYDAFMSGRVLVGSDDGLYAEMLSVDLANGPLESVIGFHALFAIDDSLITYDIGRVVW